MFVGRESFKVIFAWHLGEAFDSGHHLQQLLIISPRLGWPPIIWFKGWICREWDCQIHGSRRYCRDE